MPTGVEVSMFIRQRHNPKCVSKGMSELERCFGTSQWAERMRTPETNGTTQGKDKEGSVVRRARQLLREVGLRLSRGPACR